jgi:hypothetical protein
MLQDNRKHSCGSTEVRSTVLKENLGVAYHRATRTTLRVFVIAVCLSICSFAGPSWHHAKAPRVKLYRSAKRNNHSDRDATLRAAARLRRQRKRSL